MSMSSSSLRPPCGVLVEGDPVGSSSSHHLFEAGEVLLGKPGPFKVGFGLVGVFGDGWILQLVPSLGLRDV